jgi:hypothetical protein
MFVLWRPTLGIFSWGGVLGSGDYRIQLNPDANWRTAGIETPNPDFATPASSYQFSVENVVFYAAIARMDISDRIERLGLREWYVTSKSMPSQSATLQFTVPSSARSLYIAIQASDASRNPARPPSKFVAANNQQLYLTGIQCTYSNTTKPPTRLLSGFGAGATAATNKNLLTQLYYQTVVEGRRAMMSGGIESEADWLPRGPFVAFSFVRDINDRSTEVQLYLEYTPPNGAPAWDANTNVILVADYGTLVDIQTQDGLAKLVAKIDSN